VGFQPVMPAAQAAQVGAVGGSALGVRQDVVQVGPDGAGVAAGMAAGAVPGAEKPPVAVEGR
jgi:hypothetical protein